MTFFDAQVARHTQRRQQKLAPTPLPIFDPQTGLQSDKEPWLLPWQAFTTLENYYVWRGRVVKRGGYQLLGELGSSISETADGAPHSGTSVIVNGTLDNVPLEPKGDYYITFDDGVNFTGPTILEARVDYETAPGSGSYTIKRASDGASAGAINPSQNLYTLTVALLTPSTFGGDVTVSYEYNRGLTTMGIVSYKTLDGSEHLVAMDTRRLWEYNVAQLRFVEKQTTDLWTGDDDDFPSFAVYEDELYIANGNDPVYIYDAVASTIAEADTDFDSGSGGNDLDSAQIVLPHRRRLLYFDTEENGVDEPHMVRLTNVDDPHTMTAADASRATSSGQRLVSACVQGEDDILVFFEDSHQTLHYTGDDFRFPYVWRDGSNIHGAVSKNGCVPYEGSVLTRSRDKLVAYSGQRAAPIDDLVPDLVRGWNQEVRRYTQATVAPWLDQAFVTYAEKSKDLPESMASINTQTGAVGTFTDLPFHCLGVYQQQTSVNLNDITDILDTITTKVDEWGVQQIGSPILLGGSRDSKVYVLLTGTTDSTAGKIRARARTKRLTPDSSKAWRLHRVVVRADAQTGASMTVRFFKDYENGAFLERTISLTPDSTTDEKVYRTVEVNQTAAFFQIELESNDENPNAWDSVEPWFTLAGRLRNF